MFLSNGTVASLGDNTPMYANGSYHNSSALPLSGHWAEYGELYRRQLWVGTVVRKLGTATARMPFDVMLRTDGEQVVKEQGPLAELMERPNPRLSGLELWWWTSSTYDIYGEAFWYKLRDRRGVVRELHPMHPTKVLIRRNDEGDLEYVYTGGNRTSAGMTGIPMDDIVAFKTYNPENLRRGLSVLEGLRMTLLNEDAARRANASFWKRGARPSVLLKHPKSLSTPAIERLKADFDRNHQGVDSFGGTNLLEEGLDAQIIQLNAEEMQYIESRKLNREEVCAGYDVPPPVVHILDHATFSNITEQLRSQYRDTMAPRFSIFESVVNHQLIPEFYAFRESFSRFNMDEVLRGDFEARATAVGNLIEKGVLKPKEARPMFNLPELEDPAADELYANAALLRLGSSTQGQPVATDGSLIPQQLALTTAPFRQKSRRKASVRSIMGALSQVKADKAATRAKLVDEHVAEISSIFDQQRASLRDAAAGLDLTPWDEPLAESLLALSSATTLAIGGKTAAELGGTFDASAIADWLKTDAAESAAAINKRTAEQLAAAKEAAEQLDDAGDWLGEAFDGEIGARAQEIGQSRVTMLAGLAGLVAAEQSGAATKEWATTSANPRSSHASMNGETVPIDEPFSNGMNAPGDFSGGADEVAGCNCELIFHF